MLHYHNPIHADENLTFSIDNIVLDIKISDSDIRDRFALLLDILPIKYAVNVTHWTNFRIGGFREQYKVEHQDGTSWWIGVVLNGARPFYDRIRLDFNPNKVAHHEVFQKLLNFVIVNSRPMHRTIKRFDLAVDIPVARYSCFLVKDGRAYIERRHGQEWTQYLGAKSSTVGRVKLYNKQVESNLPRPLTRLEITLDPATPFEEINFPTVYYLNDLQMVFEETKATDTERFILNALLQGYGSPKDLGRKTREKTEKLMSLYVKHVKISPKDYAAILSQLRSYINDPQTDATDPDQPPAPPPKPLPELPDWIKAAEAAEELPLSPT